MAFLFSPDYRILDELSEVGGLTAAHLAFVIHGERTRSHIALMVRSLQLLSGKGMVTRLDDEKPIAWVRTPAGTETARRHREKNAARTRPSASEAD